MGKILIPKLNLQNNFDKISSWPVKSNLATSVKRLTLLTVTTDHKNLN